MDAWKLPPKSKIYEALSAVADGRVRRKGDNQAEVISSTGTKTYIVEWNPDFSRIVSNDNASYWRGYLGYPIAAALMLLEKIDFDKRVAGLLAGIRWKRINKQFRNDYDKAIESVLHSLEAKGENPQTVRDEVDRIMAQIEKLSLQKLPRKRKPPTDTK
jgi:hypothetical protein